MATAPIKRSVELIFIVVLINFRMIIIYSFGTARNSFYRSKTLFEGAGGRAYAPDRLKDGTGSECFRAPSDRRRSSFGADRPRGLEAKGFARLERLRLSWGLATGKSEVVFFYLRFLFGMTILATCYSE